MSAGFLKSRLSRRRFLQQAGVLGSASLTLSLLQACAPTALPAQPTAEGSEPVAEQASAPQGPG